MRKTSQNSRGPTVSLRLGSEQQWRRLVAVVPLACDVNPIGRSIGDALFFVSARASGVTSIPSSASLGATAKLIQLVSSFSGVLTEKEYVDRLGRQFGLTESSSGQVEKRNVLFISI